MSQSKRRHWTAKQKLQVVLESLQSDQKVAELCRREGLSPTQGYGWRQQLMGSAEAVFADERGRGNAPATSSASASLQVVSKRFRERSLVPGQCPTPAGACVGGGEGRG